MPSYQYRDPHVKDKTVSPTIFSLTWESPYLGKTVFILRRGPGNHMHVKISTHRFSLNKLEKLQERVLRFVFHDATFPYDTLLEWGNFLSLSVYRVRCLAIEVFKCVHGNNPAYLNDLFKQSNLKYNLRDSSRLEQPKFHTFTYGLRSFRYYGS